MQMHQPRDRSGPIVKGKLRMILPEAIQAGVDAFDKALGIDRNGSDPPLPPPMTTIAVICAVVAALESEGFVKGCTQTFVEGSVSVSFSAPTVDELRDMIGRHQQQVDATDQLRGFHE